MDFADLDKNFDDRELILMNFSFSENFKTCGYLTAWEFFHECEYERTIGIMAKSLLSNGFNENLPFILLLKYC